MVNRTADHRHTGRRAPARPWWSTWVAVACWCVLSLLALVPAVIGWSVTAFYSTQNAAGTDMSVDDATAPTWVRVLCVVAILASLTLPVFVARWARKVWLGYFLLGIVMTLTVLVVGLMMFRVL